jgi:peptidoglycan-N-acetylglucosamine deacetylase
MRRDFQRRLFGMTWRRYATLLLLGGLVLTGIVQIEHTRGARGRAAVAPICRVETRERVVALSFDDGPDPAYTQTILQALSASGVRATFFLTGEHAHAYPTLVVNESRAGMEIANHTWSHVRLTDVSLEKARSEIDRTNIALEDATGARPRLFRAPYGDISAPELAMVANRGMTAVHWAIALDHYLGDLALDPTSAAHRVAQDVQRGDIILAHDARDGGIGRGPTMEAVGQLLPFLREHGYRVVTVGDLLDTGRPVRSVPHPWFWQSGFACDRS